MYTRNFFQFKPLDFYEHHSQHHGDPKPIPPMAQRLIAAVNNPMKWKKASSMNSGSSSGFDHPGLIDIQDEQDSTGSIINLRDLSDSNIAFLVTISMISGFLLLAVFVSIYYYRKRGTYHDFSGNGAGTGGLIIGTGSPTTTDDNADNLNRILLLKKNTKLNEIPPPAPLDHKSYQMNKKTPAVRSPSSTQVNPFNKKSPSPTTTLSPNNNELESVKVIGGSTGGSGNNSKQTSPIETHQPQNSLVEKSGIESNLSNQISASNKQDQQQQQQEQLKTTTTVNGSVNQATTTKKSLGKLHFKLKYSYEKRALCIVVIRCEDLLAKDSNGTLDPYVKIQLLPEKQHKAKTRVLRKSTNPIYNEEFTFYGITSQLLENLTIHFLILNFDRFSKDEILGEYYCRLNQLEFDSLEKQLQFCKEIQPCGNKLKIQDLGELLVSLCYQPIANRLTVVILKARNLPKMDLTGLCDPYVKIYVFHNNKRISKKRTHIKKRTLSPVFNESFIFDIPPEEGLDNIRLQFMVYDHDRVTRNELIGKVDLGCKTGCITTEKHWTEVIKSPRRQIAEWHKLREVNNTTTDNTTTTTGG